MQLCKIVETSIHFESVLFVFTEKLNGFPGIRGPVITSQRCPLETSLERNQQGICPVEDDFRSFGHA
jgi:hypothetical protein